jgi:hypothetical protein
MNTFETQCGETHLYESKTKENSNQTQIPSIIKDGSLVWNEVYCDLFGLRKVNFRNFLPFI